MQEKEKSEVPPLLFLHTNQDETTAVSVKVFQTILDKKTSQLIRTLAAAGNDSECL